MNYTEILALSFWDNTVLEYLIALAAFVLGIIVLKIFKYILLVKIKEIVNHTITEFDDLIIKTVDSVHWPFYLLLSLFFSIRLLNIPNILGQIVYYLLLVAGVYYIVTGLQNIVDYSFRGLAKKRGGDPSMIGLFRKASRVLLWGLAIIIFLQNLGYDITALVAGLGIGGLAIAFALQNILADIFASFSIYFDKPFEIGDFIIIGTDMGTVEKIGIKSTRIKTLQGEELVVSNKELTSTRIHNYKKMDKRRVVFNLGVVYETSTEKLKMIPEIIKQVIDKIELADLDRVHFNKFGDFSLNYEIVYYLNSSEYNDYMNVQQAINLNIKQEFEKEKIEFAYPTQTVFLSK